MGWYKRWRERCHRADEERRQRASDLLRAINGRWEQDREEELAEARKKQQDLQTMEDVRDLLQRVEKLLTEKK